MTIIILVDGELVADTVVTNSSYATQLSRGKVYQYAKGLSIACAGFAPDAQLMDDIRRARSGKSKKLLESALRWANMSDGNQFIMKPSDDGDYLVSWGDPGKRLALVVEPGDTAAIGFYRVQWYQYANKHGWTVESARAFIALVEQLHGF